MQYMKMKYRGFEFNVNPKSLKISMNKKISRYDTVYAEELCAQGTNRLYTVSGNGCFVGEDSAKKAFELVRAYNKKGSDYLFLPNSVPIKACFSSLSISYSAGNDRVDYSFEFVQECKEKNEEHNPDYTVAADGENLFDIAHRTGMQIENLVEANDFGDVFAVKESDRVWLI